LESLGFMFWLDRNTGIQNRVASALPGFPASISTGPGCAGRAGWDGQASAGCAGWVA